MNIPTDTPAWNALQEECQRYQADGFRLRELFASKSDRASEFSLCHDHLLLDFSKNFIDQDTLKLLTDLADECGLTTAIDAMFNGDKINSTEQRPALHTALREPEATNERTEVNAALAQMDAFIEAVHSGSWTGHSGKAITDVVNLGIGGSDLGPSMVTEALTEFATGQVKVHFVSNVDPNHLRDSLVTLQPETTLFIIASKSFTTLETHQNAQAARQWLLEEAHEEAIARHFVAISSNLDAAKKFGLAEENLFPMWDWVGGRYSLWSAIGLPIAMSIGMVNFRQLLAGAHSMDRHFQQTKPEENLPVVMALLTVWYNAFFDCHSSAIVPYSQRLNQFPAYLQQLYMESLGKQTDKAGRTVNIGTAEVVWGTAGSNGQHSYFQLLHQGTEFIPVDFIAVAKADKPEQKNQHQHLLANCFSQSLALMEGKVDTEYPHKSVPGNKPSNTLLLADLSPGTLGSLIALYEHKVFVQSVLWNINAFDQWGVELGKSLSQQVYAAMTSSSELAELDGSSVNLINKTLEWDEQTNDN